MAEQTKNKRFVFYWVQDYQGCGWYRAHTPGMALLRRGHQVVLDHEISPADVHAADVIVAQMKLGPEVEQVQQLARSTGKTYVFELDDDLWNLHPANPAYHHWKQPHIQAGLDQAVMSADIVTTTTEVLAQRIRKMRDRVVVLPNMLPAEHWPAELERDYSPEVVAIGWAGGASHWADLRLLDGVLHTILDQYPDNSVFLAAGGPEETPFKRHQNMQAIQPVNIERLASLISTFDIGLAPLVDDRFNACKSDLKYLEYAMVGLPVIASNVETYSETIVHGETGFLAKTPKDWIKYLRMLVEDAELRERIGRAARAYAETRTSDRNVHLWEKAYGIAE